MLSFYDPLAHAPHPLNAALPLMRQHDNLPETTRVSARMLGLPLPLFLDLLQTLLESRQAVVDSDASIIERLLALQIDRRLDPKGIIGQHRHLFCLWPRGRLSLLLQLFAHLAHALLDGFAHLNLQFAVLFIDRARGFSQDMELAELMRNVGPEFGDGLLE